MVAALAISLGAGTLGGAVDDSAAAVKKHKKKHKKKTQHTGWAWDSQITGGTWASQITLSLTTPTHFEGTVSSQLGACRSQRYVIVYYTDPSTHQVLPLSVQRTDSAGHYHVDLPKPAFAGSYMAQVSEEQIWANRAPQVCKFASSASLTVSG